MCKPGGAAHRCPSSTSRAKGGSRLSRGSVAQEVRANAFRVAESAYFLSSEDVRLVTEDETYIKRNGDGIIDPSTPFSELPDDVAKPLLRRATAVVNEVGEQYQSTRTMVNLEATTNRIAANLGVTDKIDKARLRETVRKADRLAIDAAEDNRARTKALDVAGKRIVNHKSVDTAWFDAYQRVADEAALPPGVGDDHAYVTGSSRALSAAEKVLEEARHSAITASELDAKLAKLTPPRDPAEKNGYVAAIRNLRATFAETMTDSRNEGLVSPIKPLKDTPPIKEKFSIIGRSNVVKYADKLQEGQRARVLLDDGTAFDGVVRRSNQTVTVEDAATGIRREVVSPAFNNLTPHNLVGVRVMEEQSAKERGNVSDELFGGGTKDISIEDARAILTEKGYDAYGKVRIYGYLPDGQIASIKSVENLDRAEYLTVYTVTH